MGAFAGLGREFLTTVFAEFETHYSTFKKADPIHLQSTTMFSKQSTTFTFRMGMRVALLIYT